MAPHAGFAAVLGISQRMLGDLLRGAYLAGDLPHGFQADGGIPGVIEFQADLFLDAPAVTLSPAYPTSLLIDIQGWGPMTISLQDVPEDREVLFTARLEAPIDVSVDEGLVIGVDTGNIILLDKSFSVFSGGAFSADALAVLTSPVFHGLLEQAIRDNLDLEDGLPPIPIDFLDQLLGPVTADGAAEVVATARVVDGALMIGLDVAGGLSATAGNAAELANVLQGLDLTLWVNPELWVPSMQLQLREGTETEDGVREQVEAAGATLDAFYLVLDEGFLFVSGSAHNDLGVAFFDFEIHPRLIRPATYEDLGADEEGDRVIRRTPAREELWFEVENIDVSVIESVWVAVIEGIVGTLTSGLGFLVAHSFNGMIRWNIAAEIRDNNSVAPQDRTIVFQPDPDGPEITAHIETFEFHRDGIFMGLSMRTEFDAAALYSPSHGGRAGDPFLVVDAEDLLYGASLDVAVRLPHLVALDDPYLRIRWTVRKVDDNSILLSRDDVAEDNTLIRITSIANAQQLRVSCRVYRALGETVTEHFDGVLNVLFRDRLDRRHPFVRWFHYVWTPDVTVEADGSHTIEGGHIKYRESQIHRTGIPGRCRMVSRYSLRVPRGFRPPFNKRPRLEYLDALPFPAARVANHLDQVCEYCFFGGPHQTAPVP